MHVNPNNKGTPTPASPTATSPPKTTTKTTTSQSIKKGQVLQVKGEEVLGKSGFFSKNVKVNINMESGNNNSSVSGGRGGGGLPLIGNNLVLNQHAKAKAAFKMPVTNGWGVAGSTQVQIRTSHTVRIILGLLVLFVLTGFVLSYRIQSLETRNADLEAKLADMEDRLRIIDNTVTQLQHNVPTIVPDLSAEINNVTEEKISLPYEADEDNNEDADFGDGKQEEGVSSLSLDSRSSAETLKRLKRSIDLMSAVDANGTGIHFPAFKNAPVTPTQPGLQPSTFGYGSQSARVGRKRERGNQNKRTGGSQKLAKLSDSVMKKQMMKDKNNIAKLNLKLETARTRAKSASNLAKALLKQQASSTFSAPPPRHDPRAVYLTVRDPNINIEHPELELIGPWYMADSGKDIGFNDLWYQKLTLDENGTSVMFQESGLYLIYAQVFYKSVTKINQRPAPMGFRIYLKKGVNVHNQVFHRPIPIAECVPSYPSTFYQTCFTQICWFVEQGDEVYLEHFTDARPIIEAEKMGQTFLGIVRLSP